MSGSNSQSLGIIDILWGGVKILPDQKSTSFSPGGLLNTKVVAGRSVGFAQNFDGAMVTASFPLKSGMSLTKLRALNGQEMQVKCDSGQTYTINNAVIVKDFKVKGGAGNNISLEWSGDPALEVGV